MLRAPDTVADRGLIRRTDIHMVDADTRDTEIQDLSLSVIRALSMLDVSELSHAQLRRLNAALLHAGDDVAREIRSRGSEDLSGDTVRVPSPRLDHPR